MSRKSTVSRRGFIRSGALVAAAFAAPSGVWASTQARPSSAPASPIRLGLASYTFRDFGRAQMIGFMTQLNVFALNAKDVKDHLPMQVQQETAALEDYAAAGIKLHAAEPSIRKSHCDTQCSRQQVASWASTPQLGLMTKRRGR